MKMPQLPKVNTSVVVGVVVGLAAFGAILYVIRKAPSNAVTDPIKKVAAIAATA